MDIVLSNFDLLYKILDNLNYQEVSAIGLVNHLFNKISVSLYSSKWRINILQPVQSFLIPKLSQYIELYKNDTFLHIQDLHTTIIALGYECIQYWSILLKNLALMEQVFWVFAVHEKNILRFIQQKQSFETNKIILLKYFYVDYPYLYTVAELKVFARFKNIPHYNSKKRMQLINNLKRNQDELFFNLSIETV